MSPPHFIPALRTNHHVHIVTTGWPVKYRLLENGQLKQ
jgi:hypothetical protein